MHDPPLAYFLTWTTHGTHLHGDERGSVDRDHNTYGTPLLPTDAERETAARALLKDPIVILDQAKRSIVHRAIEDHCRIRSWRTHALNVRTNHVHIVVTADQYKPELVMDQLKGWGTRRLREGGLMSMDQTVWTSHGSTRYIWDTVGFAEAIDYVKNRQ
ncbi:MAG: transposase [Phycisphaerales bacterium]|nr:transposase [Phycisphaerales bacterium]